MRASRFLFLTASCLADTVTMKDGTFLKGHIERIVAGVLEMRVPALGDDTVQHFASRAGQIFLHGSRGVGQLQRLSVARPS